MFRRPLPVTTAHPLLVRTSESQTSLWSEVAALIALAALIGVLLYYAQFSGSMQWLLGVAFLAGLALFAWGLILRRTAEPAPLEGPPTPGTIREGELEALAAAVKRASRGLAYSQVLVASRARAAFVERVRLALGLSPESMREAQRDPAALQRILHDDVLEDFVHLQIGDLEERYRWVVEARQRDGFGPEFLRVLGRMEAWK
ncbi:MAG: hypothetical protein E6K14_06450 [Methanobacteriota archaeon]|nr:MAG: hypothetical protein E6K14_06450 [Euryarchaeota archaeon]